ncbi:DUF397 domain-containing protein [Nocardia sp. NPDC050710]|uniref:DUF397 domain-containing protein n=1 Tax=Nocardia sp. NPDC050710 TaxID=3157220 RepID=UPI0033C5DE35
MTGQRPLDGYRTPSASDGGGQCVRVRRIEGAESVFIRDSKYQRDPRNRAEQEPIIEMPSGAWDDFEAMALNQDVGAETGTGQPSIEHTAERGVVLRGADGTTLEFTEGEWSAFRDGLLNGEFEPWSIAA